MAGKHDDNALAMERSFLGREFLTWLWFRCEAEGGEYDLQPEPVAVMVEDGLALTSFDGEGAVVTLRNGTPTVRPEAASALGAGLVLKRAKLFLARGPREWQLTLDGETLDVGSVKVPQLDEDVVESEDATTEEAAVEGEGKKKKSKPKDGLTEEDELVAKLLAAEEARDVIEALYQRFLEMRLGKDWEKIELPRMRDWVKKKLEMAAEEVGAA